jgi:hypothetical protein
VGYHPVVSSTLPDTTEPGRLTLTDCWISQLFFRIILSDTTFFSFEHEKIAKRRNIPAKDFEREFSFILFSG